MEIFVPGRLCVLGEHTDWAVCYSGKNNLPDCSNSGACIVATTNEGLYCRAEALEEPVLEYIYRAADGAPVSELRLPLSYDALAAEAANPHSFFRYVAGTAAVMLQRYPPKESKGLRIDNHLSTLPPRRGLSSSAAVCVATVKSYAAVFGLELSLGEIMDCAYKGERLTPSMCGRLDQSCAMDAGCVAVIRFTPDDGPATLQRIYNPVPFYFVVADLGSDKDTTVILQRLRSCFEPATDGADASACVSSFPDGADLVREYVVTNADRVASCIAGFEGGAYETVAGAMMGAQSAFDAGAVRCAPEQLSSPTLRRVLKSDALKQYVLAGKGVGSQGDGSVQFLCADAEAQATTARLLQEACGCKHVYTLTIPPASAGSPQPVR